MVVILVCRVTLDLLQNILAHFIVTCVRQVPLLLEEETQNASNVLLELILGKEAQNAPPVTLVHIPVRRARQTHAYLAPLNRINQILDKLPVNRAPLQKGVITHRAHNLDVTLFFPASPDTGKVFFLGFVYLFLVDLFIPSLQDV